MSIDSITASAGATVANQPGFDAGGFPIKVLTTIAGRPKLWETLRDQVSVTVSWQGDELDICLRNNVQEKDVLPLPVDPLQNTAGRAIVFATRHLDNVDVNFPRRVSITVEKGLSIRGTGLGSSGASPAAALRAFEEVLYRSRAIEMSDETTRTSILSRADHGVPDNSIPAYFGGLVLVDHSTPGRISIERIERHPKFGCFVIVTPRGIGIETGSARRLISDMHPPANNSRLMELMIEALKNGDTAVYGRLMEEAHSWFVGPRSRLYPGGGSLYDAVYRAGKSSGALGVTISGSGPSMVALVGSSHEGRNVGVEMHAAFRNAGFDSVAYSVDIDDEGAQIVEPTLS